MKLFAAIRFNITLSSTWKVIIGLSLNRKDGNDGLADDSSTWVNLYFYVVLIMLIRTLFRLSAITNKRKLRERARESSREKATKSEWVYERKKRINFISKSKHRLSLKLWHHSYHNNQVLDSLKKCRWILSFSSLFLSVSRCLCSAPRQDILIYIHIFFFFIKRRYNNNT